MEKKRRTILKSVTFRILATIVTIVLVYIFTGNLALANTIGIFDLVSKLVLYYIHERVWNKISWGLRKPVIV